MEPEEALHWHILRRKKDGVEDQIDRVGREDRRGPDAQRRAAAGDEGGRRQVRRRRADPAVRAAVRRGDEARGRAARELPRQLEGYTKGTVVLATVFGDVHDIGKSLVNTILTNNGYTVVDLGKQVPIGTIIDAAKEHDATAIGLSALLVSTSKQMPLCVQELHQHGLEFPVLIGGAAINRDFGLRALYPDGKESDDVYEPGVFYCKDAFEGLAMMDQLVDADGARAARREGPRGRAPSCARRARSRGARHRRRHRALRRAHRHPGPRAAVLGRARDRGRPRRGLPPPRHARAVQAALGRPRREGRGVEQAARRGLPAAPGAHVAREDLPAPARAARLLPLLQRGQRDRRARPRGPRDGARARSSARASPAATASASPTSTARRTAASSTSSRCRPSPPATRSPS